MPTLVVVVAARPPGVSVAELIAAALAKVEFEAPCAPAASSPPAETVTAAAGGAATAEALNRISNDHDPKQILNVP
jgi:hypothetical protein